MAFLHFPILDEIHPMRIHEDPKHALLFAVVH